MIASFRVVFWIALVALVTPVVVVCQIVAMKTGWFRETIFPPIWHRSIVRALGLRVKIVGRMAPTRPLLIASNHISWVDISVIGAHFDVQFIAKAEMSNWPVMGYLSKLQRTVFVERERRRKSGQQASEIAQRMAAGHAMVLFPEGTTADGNFILPFKSSLFGAAGLVLDETTVERVYIQPLSIAYTRVHGMAMGRKHRAIYSWAGGEGLWPSLLKFLRAGSIDVELRFGEPVEFSKSAKRKQIAAEVETAVRRQMSDSLALRQETKISYPPAH